MANELLEAYRLLQAGAEALTLVEENGVCIDVPYCHEKLQWVNFKLHQAEVRLRRSPLGRAWIARYGEAWRYASVPQLRSVLYADLHVKSLKQSNGGADSVDEESLKQTNVDGVQHLLQIRRFKKAHDVLASYLRYAIDGKLHPSFLLHTVATYRSSSSNPNLQNVPKRDKEIMDICRRAIVPTPGNLLLEIDFSGIEVAIAACYHKDPVMLRYLNDPASDMHADMAQEIFLLPKFNTPLKQIDGFGTLRQASKNGFVFPEFYGDFYLHCAFNIACSWCKLPQHGMWRKGQGVAFNGLPLADHLATKDIDSLDSFTDHIRTVESDFWTKRFRVYNEWRKNAYARYQRKGEFAMKTGFRCRGLFVKNQVINYPVQGSAFHCLLWTLIHLVKELKGRRSKVIGEIHDSAIIDVHPDEFAEVIDMARDVCTVQLPRAWSWIIVPMRVEVAASEVDGNWSEMRVVA